MTMETVTPEDVGFSSARLQRIDDTMRRFVDDGKIAGAVTLVTRRGKVAHWRTCGRMDIAADRSMERDAIFRIYSMTKPVTAAVVMMLFEEGHFLLGAAAVDAARRLTDQHLPSARLSGARRLGGSTLGDNVLAGSRPVPQRFLDFAILRSTKRLIILPNTVRQRSFRHVSGRSYHFGRW